MRGALFLIVALALAGCNNNPWPAGQDATNTLFSAVSESSPRHLDPVASYWSNDTPYTYQIYEPPYGYHVFKRPFQLVPKSAREVVKPRYLGKGGQPLPEDAPSDQVVESVYDVPIKTGILYQPHRRQRRRHDAAAGNAHHAIDPGRKRPRREPRGDIGEGKRCHRRNCSR